MVIAALVTASIATARPASSGPTPGPTYSKLDARLLRVTESLASPVAVWVEFTDKGEQGPDDLAQRLAAAAAALTPESRRRRERARVTPLVDYLDLPVSPEYLHALEAQGFAVYGASRWFNRVAVHAAGDQLFALAAQPFVRRLSPVELARPREREEMLPLTGEGEGGGGASAPGRGALPAAVQALYGQTLGQLQRLNMPAVHDSGYIGTAISVCVLDDGFNWFRKHEALRTIPVGVGRTRDFIRGGTDVQDTVLLAFNFVHGTATLSALAGRKSGVYLAPAYGCIVALGRTEDSGSEKPIEMVYWGMGAEWADSLGCDILTSSLGYNLFPDSAGTDITYPMLNGHTTIVTRAAEIAAAKERTPLQVMAEYARSFGKPRGFAGAINGIGTRDAATLRVRHRLARKAAWKRVRKLLRKPRRIT